jgi:anti-sigma factor (TIGR02949 family)
MWLGSVALSEISCDQILQEIELYIDGELDADHTTVFASHLASCTPCLEHASFQAKLKEILRSKCRLHMPEHVEVRIRTMIRIERFER